MFVTPATHTNTPLKKPTQKTQEAVPKTPTKFMIIESLIYVNNKIKIKLFDITFYKMARPSNAILSNSVNDEAESKSSSL